MRFDPIANGLLNKDGNYELQNGLFDDLKQNHEFGTYYQNGLKSTIKEVQK